MTNKTEKIDWEATRRHNELKNKLLINAYLLAKCNIFVICNGDEFTKDDLEKATNELLEAKKKLDDAGIKMPQPTAPTGYGQQGYAQPQQPMYCYQQGYTPQGYTQPQPYGQSMYGTPNQFNMHLFPQPQINPTTLFNTSIYDENAKRWGKVMEEHKMQQIQQQRENLEQQRKALENLTAFGSWMQDREYAAKIDEKDDKENK